MAGSAHGGLGGHAKGSSPGKELFCVPGVAWVQHEALGRMGREKEAHFAFA